MDTGKYILRSLRYVLRIVVIIGMVMAIMAAAGMLDTQGGSLYEMFVSKNGLLLLGVLILLAGAYPKLAFGEVKVKGDIHADRRKIKDTMESYGFVTAREDEDSMVFRAAKISRRLAAQFDDAVTVTGADGGIWLEGMKKDVVRIAGRLENSINGPE